MNSPIEHPTVEIQGVQYKVKFGLGALYRLEKFGLAADNLFDAGKSLTTIVAVLAATLGNDGPDGKWIPLGMTPEQLADIIPMEKLGELSQAISAASSKASPALNGAGMPETAETPVQ